MTTLDALRTAWARVRQGGGAAGTDGLTVADFARVAHEELPRLCEAMQEGTYRPQPLRYASLKKSAGSCRELAYPTVRDRIAQTAVYQRLSPWLDRTFLDVSFGYRPGRSYLDAVQAVLDARTRGFDFVLDADIEAFFQTVPHGPLLHNLRERGLERALVRLVRGWLKAPICKRGRLLKRRRTGLPQGAVISPLLANCYLHPFDRRMLESEWPLVRYADDFVVLCQSRRDAEHARHVAGKALKDLNLHLHAEKTRVASFEGGFFFLGHHFQGRVARPRKQAEQRGYGRPITRPAQTGSRSASLSAPPTPGETNLATPALAVPAWTVSLSTSFTSEKKTISAGDIPGDGASSTPGGDGVVRPSANPAPSAESTQSSDSPSTASRSRSSKPFQVAPRRSADAPRGLYLQRQGATLRLRQGRFVLKAPGSNGSGDSVLDVPTRKISHIVVFGACHLTLAAKRHCLREGVPVTYLTQSGAYYGQLTGAPPSDTGLLFRQLQRTRETETRLQVGRALIDAKLANSHSLLRRHAGDDAVDTARRRIQRLRRRLPQAGTLDVLRGLEGAGTAAFFGVLGRLIKAPGFTFERRTRRPPTDPVNALLSLGYTLLYNHARAFLHVHGLHAHAGFLHEARPDHPALASDLVEPFRVLVDRLVLRLLNRRVLQPGDFQPDRARGDGVPRQGACLLASEGRGRFFRAFEELLSQEVRRPGAKRPVTYRRCFDRAAQNIARFVQGEAEFEPFRLR